MGVWWTEEKVSELIELYKMYPELWDTKSREYKNRDKKSNALKAISEVMAVDIVEVERKINVLLAQYRKTRSRVLTMKGRGLDPEGIVKSIWYGYKQLSFLEDRYANCSRPSDVQGEVTANYEEASSDAEPASSVQQPKVEEVTELRTEDCLESKVQVCLSEGLAAGGNPGTDGRRTTRRAGLRLRRCCWHNKRSEVDLFCGQVALKLVKFSPPDRARLMHSIHTLLHHEEMKLYRRE